MITKWSLSRAAAANDLLLGRENYREAQCAVMQCRQWIPAKQGHRLLVQGKPRGYVCADCARWARTAGAGE